MSEAIVFPIETSELDIAEDRRGAVRHLGNHLCYVKPNGKNSGVAWGVQLLDLSLQGVSLILRCELEPDTVIAIQSARGNIRQALFARVVRTDKHEQGWLCGCEFLRPIDEQELQRWLNRVSFEKRDF